VDAPYVVCPIHTQKAWEEYEAAQATEPPTEPEKPEEVPETDDAQATE